MFASGRGNYPFAELSALKHHVAALQAISRTYRAWRSCAAGMASFWQLTRRMPHLCAATGRPILSLDSIHGKSQALA